MKKMLSLLPLIGLLMASEAVNAKTFQGKIKSIDTSANIILLGTHATGAMAETTMNLYYSDSTVFTLDGTVVTEKEMGKMFMIKTDGTFAQDGEALNVTGVTKVDAVTPR